MLRSLAAARRNAQIVRRLTAVATGLALSMLASLCESAVDPSQLPGILDRLGKTAARSRETALKFACAEKISWVPFRKRGSVRFNYVFEFGKGYGFSNYRTPSGSPVPGKAPREVTPEQADVPAYLGSAYLWLFSFRADRQARHEYQLLDSVVFDGHPAAVIFFEPRSPVTVGINDWFGTAWVDLDTAQLLKVEAYSPADWAELEKMKQHLARGEGAGGRYTIQRITTFFSVEDHGMRFPGKVELRNEEHHVSWRSGRWSTWKSTLLQVDQEYTNYEFFGVDTTVRRAKPR